MGSRFVMNLLGLSILRVSVMDCGDYWATSSEDFLHTAPQIPFFMYTRLRCYPFWSIYACLYSMGQEGPTTSSWSQDQTSLTYQPQH